MSAIRHAPMNARLARFQPDRFTLLLIAIALLGTGLVLARHVTYSVVLWGDSSAYISTALGLLAGEGLTVLWAEDTNPHYGWPPLYPMLLAAGSLGLFDPYDVAGPFGAVCHGLTILVAGQWLRRHVRSPVLAIWGSLAIALSFSLIMLAEAAATDALFSLLSTLSLTRFSAWNEEPKRATLLQAAVFTALACLTRYPGVALIPVFVLMLLLQRNTSLVMKSRNIAGYALISGIPIALYLIKNYLYRGTFINFEEEERQQGVRTVLGILEETIRYVGGWMMPGFNATEIIHLVLPIFLISSVMAGFVLCVKKKAGLYPFLIYLPVYLAVIIVSLNSGVTFFGLEERFITVLYVPSVFILLVSMDGVIHTGIWRVFRISERIPTLGGIAGIAVIVSLILYSWIGYNAKINAEEIRFHNSEEYYRSIEFNSPIRSYIKDISDGTIWGNLFHIDVYFHTGKNSDEYRILPDNYTGVPKLIERADIGDYIIWWVYPPPQITYTFEDLLASEGLDFVTTLQDGHVLRVSKRTHAEKYAATTSRDPDIASEFDVYLSGGELSWIKDPCHQFEIQDPIFVHIIPTNISVLPEDRRHHGFDNLDFFFRSTGVMFDGRCMATIFIPDYQISTIITGQQSTSHQFWRGQFHPPTDTFPDRVIIWSGRIESELDTLRLQEEYDSITSGEPSALSVYSVWIDEPYISYTKEPCGEADTTALFFLHVVAVDVNDLPDTRKEHGFDNLDFVFEPETGSMRFDGKCMATRLLPEYPIDSIRTGQYDASGELWSVEIIP